MDKPTAASIIAKGTLVLLTTGEYSEYQVHTLCRATADIAVLAVRAEYLALHPEQEEDYHFRVGQFLKWLIVDKALAEEVEYQEWFLGAYSCPEFRLDDLGIGDVATTY